MNSIKDNKTEVRNYESSNHIDLVKFYASIDDANAQFELGTYYESGIHVCKNLEKAKTWFERAALNGHPQAIEKLKL